MQPLTAPYNPLQPLTVPCSSSHPPTTHPNPSLPITPHHSALAELGKTLHEAVHGGLEGLEKQLGGLVGAAPAPYPAPDSGSSPTLDANPDPYPPTLAPHTQPSSRLVSPGRCGGGVGDRD